MYHTINGIPINITLNKGYFFGEAYEKFIKKGLEKGIKQGCFKSNIDKTIIGTWTTTENYYQELCEIANINNY